MGKTKNNHEKSPCFEISICKKQPWETECLLSSLGFSGPICYDAATLQYLQPFLTDHQGKSKFHFFTLTTFTTFPRTPKSWNFFRESWDTNPAVFNKEIQVNKLWPQSMVCCWWTCCQRGKSLNWILPYQICRKKWIFLGCFLKRKKTLVQWFSIVSR